MADAINRTGTHHANLLEMNSFIQNTSLAQQVCSESDLLIVYRYLYGPILTAIQYWKARDKKVIVDFDQSFEHLVEGRFSYSFWFDGIPLDRLGDGNSAIIDPPPVEQFKWGLTMVDAATVPSVRLVDDWSRFTSVYKVLDYINTSHYPMPNPMHENEIWIGLGSRVDFDCFQRSGLLAAMENVCRKCPQVRLVLSNMDDANRMIHINPKQLQVHSPRCFEDWVDVLLDMNIALLPIYGDYDLRLGSYDLLEFMISKIPWIASGELAFHNFSQYGQWVPNTSAAWEKVILATVEQLDLHQKKAARDPFLFALTQDISVNIARILKVYDSVLNS
ncbi:MAG: hypothetical protein U0V02_16005 [Anaerolineales bacterium]